MKLKHRFVYVALFCLAHSAGAQDLRQTLFVAADRALETATEARAPLLAPRAFERGAMAYTDAESDLERGRNLERIRDRLAEATEYFRAASEAAAIASITLASAIETRDEAAAASADTFAAELWAEAESLFDDAARRLEVGSINAARERAADAEAAYRDAELTAIKAQYLSQTRALLAQAEQARVPRYAPRTYQRAASLLQQAEQQLNENRYDTDLPRSLAQQANYEAGHAIYLAERIQEMRDARWTEEDIILAYEEPMIEIAAAADIAARLDAGTEPVEAELVAYIEDLRQHEQQLQTDAEENRRRIVDLEEEIRELDERLGGVSEERVALVQRLEAEAANRAQFERIESLFGREEATIYREGNNTIIRLVGLTFASGSANVDPAFRPVLEKVRAAVAVFPRSRIVIEGHTDSYGSDDANLALSRARAQSVGTFLTDEFGVASFRISAIGYGETRPIANNETDQGRTRNRRIDLRIEPQIE
jgi:outer membrane protein OmpA-like peptidoglycan-associated protein